MEDYLLHEPNGTPFILLKRPALYARLVPDFQIFFSICLFILSFLGPQAISFYLHASFHCFAPRIQSLLSGSPMNFFPSTFHLGFLLIFFRLLFEFCILRASLSFFFFFFFCLFVSSFLNFFFSFSCWQVVLLISVRRHNTDFFFFLIIWTMTPVTYVAFPKWTLPFFYYSLFIWLFRVWFGSSFSKILCEGRSSNFWKKLVRKKLFCYILRNFTGFLKCWLTFNFVRTGLGICVIRDSSLHKVILLGNQVVFRSEPQKRLIGRKLKYIKDLVF